MSITVEDEEEEVADGADALAEGGDARFEEEFVPSRRGEETSALYAASVQKEEGQRKKRWKEETEKVS